MVAVDGERPSVCVRDRRDVGEPHQPMLTAKNLTKHFTLAGGRVGQSVVVQAVDDISVDIHKGETLGIVGESGCGKSTTARLLIGLAKPDSGTLIFEGKEIGSPRGGASVRTLQRSVQMVFQDSYASLNPRLTVQDTIAFGPRISGH